MQIFCHLGPLVLGAAVLPLLVGCDDGGTSSTRSDLLTLVMVHPEDFPGELSCGEDAGTGSYVATLLDMTGDLTEGEAPIEEFAVDTSPPTACTDSLGFSLVYPDRAYEALVELYPETDSDPSTVDVCTVEGTRAAVTRVDGTCTDELATPVGTLRCHGWVESATGSAAPAGRPAIAIEYRSVSLHYCEALP